MSTHAGAYDTSRLYRTASHAVEEDRSSLAVPPPPAFVADDLRPAAGAVLAYREYLMAVADLPRDQQALLEVLCRQARTLLGGLSALARAGAPPGSGRASVGPEAIA